MLSMFVSLAPAEGMKQESLLPLDCSRTAHEFRDIHAVRQVYHTLLSGPWGRTGGSGVSNVVSTAAGGAMRGHGMGPGLIQVLTTLVADAC